MTTSPQTGWHEVPSEQYCDSVRDGTHDSPKFLDAGFPLITSKNIKDGRITLESANLISETNFKEINRRSKVDQWDVLFSMIGTVGEVCLVREEEPGYAIKNIGLFKTGSELKGQWLYYWLTNPHTKATIKQAHRGASQQYIPLGELRQLPIRVPKNQQVANRILQILSTYDVLIENNRRRMALLEESARLLYREWFVCLRFPGYEHAPIVDGVPEGWEQKRIGDLADCIGGGTPSTKVPGYWEDGDIAWVTPTDVTRNSHIVLLDSERKITAEGLKSSSATMVPPHAVLMTSRASVGFFAIAGRDVCTNQGFISIVAHDPVLATFLLFHLSERVEEIRSMGSGSTFPEVSRSKFREFKTTVPSKRLVADFDEQATILLKQIRVLKLQTEKLRAARDILLPRLMSGEIAV